MRDALPAKAHVVIDHLRVFHRFPNLKHPTTFNDKIAHRILYDRDPRMPQLVDKISAKQLMAARFGADFVIPTLARYDNAAEVDFALLPYPCVIKPSHTSGFNVFLKERPTDERRVRRKLSQLLRYRYERAAEEWAYTQVEARLLVEPFIDAGPPGLTDYKLHTFSGRVFAIQADVDRYTNHARTLFDRDWNPMPFSLLYPRATYSIPRPSALDAMIQRAEQIGEGFSYIRVDLYEISGKPVFGEATFYPSGGLGVFTPREYDALFGAQWKM